MTEFILVVPEFYTLNTDAFICSQCLRQPSALSSGSAHCPILHTYLYLVQALKAPEGDLCQKRKKKPSHFIARSFPWKYLSNNYFNHFFTFYKGVAQCIS